MKLLDLNTHSLEEKDMHSKQQIFSDFVAQELPDVIALQEVNQTMSAPEVNHLPESLVMVQHEIPLRQDNHALQISRLLEEKGLNYQWAWLPIKVGYSRYDEGLAVFSRKPILETDNVLVSNIDDYANYRTRRILGIRNKDGWFYDAHMSWWNDPDEPFARQWLTLEKQLSRLDHQPVWLMGDFNGDAAIRNENYDLIARSDWQDSWLLADVKDDGMTVSGIIDGWRDQASSDAKRIDQIWSDRIRPVRLSKVVFNGKEEPVISDHFGILVETE